MQHILKKLKMLLPKASKYTWWDEYQLVNSQPMLNFPDELETYNKIIRVIKSCINSQQLRAASIMVDQFYWLHCNAVATESLNKKVLLKRQSFRMKSLEE
jgi:hypothetical protein